MPRPALFPADVEWALSRFGAVKTELEEDPQGRSLMSSSGSGSAFGGSRYGARRGRYDSDDEEDDR